MIESTLVNYGDGPRAIYEVLKSRIVEGDIVAGSELKIGPLASYLGVSIVPLREAVRMLAAEDLVELRPRRSPLVSHIREADLIEINNIRRALEPMVLGDAVPRHDAASLARCQALVEDDRTCPEIWQRVEINVRFHLMLLVPSAMARAKSIIENQYVGMSRIFHFLVMNHPDLVDLHEREHAAILAAVEQGDADGAAALMEAHIDQATERALPVIHAASAGPPDTPSA